MPTLNDLISQTQGMLRSYTRNSEQSTHLASSITNNATSMTVADGSQISRGVCEIDDEMIWIDSVSTSSGATTIAPYGRGFNNTSAAAHNTNTRVVMNPLFPRKQIKDEINNTLRSLRGYLCGFSTATFTYNPSVVGYELPASTNTVARVEWKEVGPYKSYARVKGWRFNPMADTSVFTTGKSIEIYDGIVPGQTIQVWLTTDISTLENNTDNFSFTGLPDSCYDMIMLGAASRLMATVDARNLDLFSAEASAMADKVPQGSSSNISKYLYSMFVQRRNDEVALQNINTPITTHWSR